MSKFLPDHDALVRQRFENILGSCPNCAEVAKADAVRRAFEFAYHLHRGKLHRSGEPFIHHLLSVMEIALRELRLGPKSAMAALLHHVLDETDYTVTQLAELFGDKVAYLVDSLHRIVNARDWYVADEAENFSRLLLSVSDDLRVLLLRFADRLHVLRTLDPHDKVYRTKIANESIQVYAKLAHRVGLYNVKKELEDLGFRNQKPHVYRLLALRLKDNEEKRTKFINNFSLRIIGDLTRENIDFRISGRPKTIFSIYNKMRTKKVSFREVYDLSAIRIIFKPRPDIPEITQCWKIYDVVSRLYTPVHDRLRDWVSQPKSSGYEALHATLSIKGRFVEVQIRSERMHEIAELGLAAHWKYKGVTDNKARFDQQIREIQQLLKDPSVDKIQLLDDFKLSLLSSEIMVFALDNSLKSLPKNASVLDFAYAIHTDLAHRCIGAKIDKRTVPITHLLANGDKVELLTAASQWPKPEWHRFVVTAKAKTDLKRLFRVEFDRFREQGEQILSRVLAEYGLKLNSGLFKKLREQLAVRDKADLCQQLGERKILEAQLRRLLRSPQRRQYVRFWTIRLDLPETFSPTQSRQMGQLAKIQEVGLLYGAANPDRAFVVAPCCNARPGDTISAHLTGNQCVVHQKQCTVLPMPSADSLVLHAEWRRHKMLAEVRRLRVRAHEHYGLMSRVAQLLDDDFMLLVQSFYFKAEGGMIKFFFDILAADSLYIHLLVEKLQAIPQVVEVEQVEHLSADTHS